jgi:hypothetical protein
MSVRLSKLEFAIMETLWAKGRVSVREVLEAFLARSVAHLRKLALVRRPVFDPPGLTSKKKPSRSYILNGFGPGLVPRIVVSVSAISAPAVGYLVVPHFLRGCSRTDTHLLGRAFPSRILTVFL